MRCYNCGTTENFVPSTEPLTTHIGNVTVIDRSIQPVVCPQCNDWVLDADAMAQVELRAAVVALADRQPMTGEILRATRRILGKTQKDLGALFEMRHETLSRHENSETTPEWLRAAMLGLVCDRLAELQMLDFTIRPEQSDAVADHSESFAVLRKIA